MAFHLHRLKLTWAALRRQGYDTDVAADISRARFALRPPDIHLLAQRLRVDPIELTRQLSPEEHREWAYYRAASSDPAHVWTTARSLWTGAGLNMSQAAYVMNYHVTVLSRAAKNPNAMTLNFAAAMRLTSFLNHPQGPEALLPRSATDDTRSRD